MKPTIEMEQIHHLLAETFGEPAAGLQPVQGGEVAQTFSFRAGRQDYILRINRIELEGHFRKEAFIHEHFSSPQIPVPPILKTGRLDDGHVYAISPRAAGIPLAELPPAEHHALVPDVIRTLHAVHSRDVSSWQGFGLFDEHGQGSAPAWRSFLAAVMDDEQGGFFDHWHGLFETSFLERDVYERVDRFLLARLDSCPKERYLLHGDYGFGNLLASDGHITALLDWINAMYGDFVYDIAWLDFWGRGHGYADQARAYYGSQGMPLQDWEARMACCTAYIGLNAMRFYARMDHQPAYQFARQALLALLGDNG